MEHEREAVESFLEANPDKEADLELLLDLQSTEPWTFDDIPLDSGEFGEIVSHGLVQEVDDGYELANPQAIEETLTGEPAETEPAPTDALWNRLWNRLQAIKTYVRNNRISATLFGGTILLTALIRIVFAYDNVFREDQIVYNAVDSYLVAYWVEHLHESFYQLSDPTTWAAFPVGLWDHDLLLHLILWTTSGIFGGSEAVGWVLAWYPVVVGTIVGGVVYLLATRLTADRRIGITALLFYALTPDVVTRTTIGSPDTEPLDLLWLALTALVVVSIVRDTERTSLRPETWQMWALTSILGVSVAAQVLTWRGGSLLLFPLAIIVVLVTLSEYAHEGRVFYRIAPLVWGFGIASMLTVSTHFLFGWLQAYRAITPMLLLIGSVGTVGFFEAMARQNIGKQKAAGIFGILGVVGLALLWNLIPPVSTGILEFVEYMQSYTWSSISETQSIFSPGQGGVISPLSHLGPQVAFGIVGLIGLTWIAITRRIPGWVVIITYGWFLWVLSAIQLRFAVYNGIFNNIFAAIAFIHLLSAAGFLRPISFDSEQIGKTGNKQLQQMYLPDRRTLFYIGLSFALLLALAIVQIPVFNDDITKGQEHYHAAAFIDQHSTEHEILFPENYVFSDRSTNRMYNYIVNENSHSYHFAFNNYSDFVSSTTPEKWYTQLSGTTGYIVTTDRSGFANESLQVRLHEQYGSSTDQTAGLGHYQAIYVTSNASHTVFELVPGATITGTAGANETIHLSTTASVEPAETTVKYNRRIQTDSQGRFEITVSYPGQYTVDGETITVDEGAVSTGETVQIT